MSFYTANLNTSLTIPSTTAVATSLKLLKTPIQLIFVREEFVHSTKKIKGKSISLKQ